MTGYSLMAMPRQRRGLRLEGDDPNVILVDTAQQQRHALNATALALWELCDGTTSVEEMVAAIAVLFDAPPDVIRRDVWSALEQMTAIGVVTW